MANRLICSKAEIAKSFWSLVEHQSDLSNLRSGHPAWTFTIHVPLAWKTGFDRDPAQAASGVQWLLPSGPLCRFVHVPLCGAFR
jgi:hypothetical protein